ncbi:hypothetical protein [Streptomyces antibioticus]|uniref:hypothetical protein n=1 Tax=Streptomyces antibioticus TaxID=1890 RepID=UPI0033F696A2
MQESQYAWGQEIRSYQVHSDSCYPVFRDGFSVDGSKNMYTGAAGMKLDGWRKMGWVPTLGDFNGKAKGFSLFRWDDASPPQVTTPADGVRREMPEFVPLKSGSFVQGEVTKAHPIAAGDYCAQEILEQSDSTAPVTPAPWCRDSYTQVETAIKADGKHALIETYAGKDYSGPVMVYYTSKSSECSDTTYDTLVQNFQYSWAQKIGSYKSVSDCYPTFRDGFYPGEDNKNYVGYANDKEPNLGDLDGKVRAFTLAKGQSRGQLWIHCRGSGDCTFDGTSIVDGYLPYQVAVENDNCSSSTEQTTKKTYSTVVGYTDQLKATLKADLSGDLLLKFQAGVSVDYGISWTTTQAVGFELWHNTAPGKRSKLYMAVPASIILGEWKVGWNDQKIRNFSTFAPTRHPELPVKAKWVEETCGGSTSHDDTSIVGTGDTSSGSSSPVGNGVPGWFEQGTQPMLDIQHSVESGKDDAAEGLSAFTEDMGDIFDTVGGFAEGYANQIGNEMSDLGNLVGLSDSSTSQSNSSSERSEELPEGARMQSAGETLIGGQKPKGNLGLGIGVVVALALALALSVRAAKRRCTRWLLKRKSA